MQYSLEIDAIYTSILLHSGSSLKPPTLFIIPKLKQVPVQNLHQYSEHCQGPSFYELLIRYHYLPICFTSRQTPVLDLHIHSVAIEVFVIPSSAMIQAQGLLS